MTPKIPRVSTWPPHMWDTTDPDEYAEAVAWVRSLMPEDRETALESPRSDEQGSEAARVREDA